MSCVRSRNTTIEKKLGKALWARDIRYRKNYQKLSGKPDFVIVRTKIAIFCTYRAYTEKFLVFYPLIYPNRPFNHSF